MSSLAGTRIGDDDTAHCSAMTRAAGSTKVFADGIGISREGANNTSHLLPPNVPPCASHAAPIASGSSKVKVDTKGCGRITDGITGCTSVAEGSSKVFAG